MILHCIRSSRGYARRKDGALLWTTLEQASVFSPERAADLRALLLEAQALEPACELRRLRVLEEDCPEGEAPCAWL